MRALYLAWNAPSHHAWYPIGRLDVVTSERYRFGYTRGVLDAQRQHGLPAHPAFPDLQQTYESAELFPLFQNRIMNPRRKGFPEYLASLDLSDPDPAAILAITGGERETDRLEVFPKIERQPNGRFECRFFLRGLSGLPQSTIAHALALTHGERLEFSEPAHLKDGQGLEMRSDQVNIGWTPRYVNELLRLTARHAMTQARVVRINRGAAMPLDRCVLVELTGQLPEGAAPMTSEPFQLIGESIARH